MAGAALLGLLLSLLLSACGSADAPPAEMAALRPVSASGLACPELTGHYQLQDPQAECCGVMQGSLFLAPPPLPAALPRDYRHAWQSVRIEGDAEQALFLTWLRPEEDGEKSIQVQRKLTRDSDYRCEAGWLISPPGETQFLARFQGQSSPSGRWADRLVHRVRPDQGAGLMVQTRGKVWQTFEVYAGSPGIGYWYSTETRWTRFPPAELRGADRVARQPSQTLPPEQPEWLRQGLPAGVELLTLRSQGQAHTATFSLSTMRQFEALVAHLNARHDLAAIQADISNPHSSAGRMEAHAEFQRIEGR